MLFGFLNKKVLGIVATVGVIITNISGAKNPWVDFSVSETFDYLNMKTGSTLRNVKIPRR